MQSGEAGKGRASSEGAGAGNGALLRLVAELYFVRDWPEAKIAELFGCSRSKVSRLLSAARRDGIVQITIAQDPELLGPLASQLSDALGAETTVTPGHEEAASSGRLCAVASAPLIAAELPSEGVIGVAGGYTVSALVDALPKRELPGITVVPIVGSYHVHDSYPDVNEIAGNLARRLQASARRILAPGLFDSADTKLALLQDSTLRATTELWGHLDLVLVGISGSPRDRPGYPTVMDQLDTEGRSRLEAKGVVGEVAGHLLRSDGALIEDEWTSRALSIPFELLRASKRVIGLASGPNKVTSIIACARSGVLSRLFTDESTARCILRALSG